MYFMNRSTIITLALLIGVVLLVAVYAWWATHVQKAAQQDQDSTDTFTAQQTAAVFTDLNGEAVDLAAYADRVRVVNSWASWCPFCVAELADFAEVAAEYNQEEVVVVAINRKEPVGTVKAYLASVGDSLTENIVFLQDESDAFYGSIGGFTMPETVFYNSSGEVVVHKRGFMNSEEMKRHIETALTQ